MNNETIGSKVVGFFETLGKIPGAFISGVTQPIITPFMTTLLIVAGVIIVALLVIPKFAKVRLSL